MKLLVKKGTTQKLLQLWVPDSASTTGAGKTGLTHSSAGLTAAYYREGAASATAFTLADMTVGTYTSGGFKEVSASLLPGLYQLGLPDAALASGANSVVVQVWGASGMAPVVLEIQLVDFDPNDATSLGLGRLDAAVSSRSTLTAAQVNAEVVDALFVDTIGELVQGQPPATPTLAQGVMLLYMALRNQLTQTASELKIRDASGAVICKASTSDDGTTFTRGQLVSGP